MVCPPPNKRKRAWAPKRRTGCRSCKIRRLRCDETRPICHRCVKSGFLCEWDVAAVFPSTDSGGTTPQPLSSTSNPHRSPTSSSTPKAQQPPTTALAFSHPHRPKTLTSFLHHHYSSSPHTTHPSAPYSPPDYVYHHYFLRHIAPLLSTTLAWRTMWSRTIPQLAWTSAAIRHALVALAACYEGMRSGRDREAVVRGKLVGSLRAFRTEGEGIVGVGVGVGREDEALIMCRVMASLCQATEDWEGARMHMAYGARMLREMSSRCSSSSSTSSSWNDGDGRGRGVRKVSEIARLVAPTYMSALSEREQESLGGEVTEEQRRIWAEIVGFRTKFKEYYVRWIEVLWDQVNRSLKAHLLTTWSTINHTINSALYPDLVFFKEEDPVVPIGEVRRQLEWRWQLYTLDELSEMADTVLREIEDYLHRPPTAFPQAATQPLEDQLRICVENYMVQAAIFEPRMSAGTYWSCNPEPECSVELRLRQFTHAESIPTGYKYEGGSHSEWQSCEPGNGAGESNEMQNFYLEHVCPYRSGLLPNRVDGCPIYKLKRKPGERVLFADGTGL